MSATALVLQEHAAAGAMVGRQRDVHRQYRCAAPLTSVRLASGKAEAVAIVDGKEVQVGPITGSTPPPRARPHLRPGVLIHLPHRPSKDPPHAPLHVLRHLRPQAHQTMMDVIGNNIANVNTVGLQVQPDRLPGHAQPGRCAAPAAPPQRPAAAPTRRRSASASRVAAITTNFTQGRTQSTGRSTDFAIQGDGFFVVRGTGEQMSTPAPARSTSTPRAPRSPRTARTVQGWIGRRRRRINTNGPIAGLTVPVGQVAHRRGRRADGRPRRQPARPTRPPAPASPRRIDDRTTARAVDHARSPTTFTKTRRQLLVPARRPCRSRTPTAAPATWDDPPTWNRRHGRRSTPTSTTTASRGPDRRGSHVPARCHHRATRWRPDHDDAVRRRQLGDRRARPGRLRRWARCRASPGQRRHRSSARSPTA